MGTEDTNHPVSISGSITDVLGAGKGVGVLVSAIERGVGKVLGPWQRKRENRAELESFAEWTSLLKQQGLRIAGGELSLGERTLARLTVDAVREQEAREDIAVEAVLDYKRLTDASNVMPEPTAPEPEWLDRFWKLAGEISSESMKSLWGRVLARKVAGTAEVSARTLVFLSTLSTTEAKRIARLGNFACSFTPVIVEEQYDDTQKACLLRQGPHPVPKGAEKINRVLVDLTADLSSSHLGSIGVYSESGWGYGADARIDDQTVRIAVAGKRYVLRSYITPLDSYKAGRCNIGSGMEITRLGQELLSLLDPEPDPPYMKALWDAYDAFGWAIRPEKV
ncbi:DUF2806 domain-containing protein [Mesorhizobium sp.]|uniref:DUF2806 domain-containing protein n=1 Tax=Mesorhizobium sp. TaxID=1871066 RepID=UPI000FD2B612|nr:DUF2806 domain-containing protein [Mesorhizobium sp.]RUV08616.1 DUF2806 domain-containing protein [Mesorhizobium sp. M7A.T.Ca.TU.009.01.3.1]